MSSKTVLRWVSFITGAVALALLIVIVFLPDTTAIGSGGTASVVLSEQTLSELPLRLTIPAIKVDAAVLPVGLTADGTMDTPKEPADVAWFDQGPRPGENGTAVIAGHFGWKNDIPAVFDDLNALQAGDKIFVENDKGAVVTFVVRALRLYGEKEDSSSVFGSSDGKAHLNLITCEGVWDKVSKSYSKRLVVFTDKE